MKKIIFLTVAMALLASCSGDEGASLSVSSNQITLDASGAMQTITVDTDQRIWRIDTEATWLTIEHNEDGTLSISAIRNRVKAVRMAKIYISAGDRHERITVSQEGALRVIGEPYPDADNPVGITYWLNEDGTHGLVLSLQEFKGSWSTVGEVNNNCVSLIDGRANTRATIAAYGSDPEFATKYPIFNWVNTLNGGNADGQWFIPAYYQLKMMLYCLSGNAYEIPAIDPLPAPTAPYNTLVPATDLEMRTQLSATMVELGGTAIGYLATNGIYWSSSQNPNNGYQAYPHASGNVSPGYSYMSAGSHIATNISVRAIMEF